MDDALPEDVDPELWFWSSHCDGRDYLYDSHWHTHPGRIAVYCPHDPDHPGYRISKSELPTDLPVATRAFVAGFLAGNLPDRPHDDDPSSPTLQEWQRAARRFAEDGDWQIEVDVDQPWRQQEACFLDDARTLARIGEVLEAQCPPIQVTVPADLAAAAIAAHDRVGYVVSARKVQLMYERAASLVHIGGYLGRAGPAVGSPVSIELDLRLVGDALHAAVEDWHDEDLDRLR